MVANIYNQHWQAQQQQAQAQQAYAQQQGNQNRGSGNSSATGGWNQHGNQYGNWGGPSSMGSGNQGNQNQQYGQQHGQQQQHGGLQASESSGNQQHGNQQHGNQQHGNQQSQHQQQQQSQQGTSGQGSDKVGPESQEMRQFWQWISSNYNPELQTAQQYTLQVVVTNQAVLSVCCDQNGSRFVQGELERLSAEASGTTKSGEYVNEELGTHGTKQSREAANLLDRFYSLCYPILWPLTEDSFSNYVVQELLKKGTPKQQRIIIRQIAGEQEITWPLLWFRIFVFSESSQFAEAAELSKCTFS